MRRPSLVLISLAAAAGACGRTDNVVGSLRGDPVSAGAAGAASGGRTSQSELAAAGGDEPTRGDGGASGEGAALSASGSASVGGAPGCVPDGNGEECIAPVCGDGVESSTESCDDGNNVNGDGCSTACSWEPLQGTPTAPPYGSAVAISGDTIVTGPFVFRLNGLVWALEAKLAAGAPGGIPDPFDDPSTSTFANAVAISGDTIAIGAQNDDEAAESAGAVHVFQRTGSTWVWQQKLLPMRPDGTHDGIASEHFGWQLAFSGDTLVVGAQSDDDQGASSGSVYVFRRGSAEFVPEAKLVATLPTGVPDGGQYFHFGTSVSLSENTLVVGSAGSFLGSVTNAAAYVFERSGSVWSARAKLLPTLPSGVSDATNGSLFGAAVAVAGDIIVVGDPESNASTGCAYVFERAGASWSARAKLQAPPFPIGAGRVASFGSAAAISTQGDLILIGSPSDSHPVGYFGGSGHVFKRDGANWLYDGALLAPVPSELVNPFNGSLGAYVAISDTEPLLGSESASYLFRPKNSAWDTRLVIRIVDP